MTSAPPKKPKIEMEVSALPLEDGREMRVALVTDIMNGKELKKKIMNGEFEASFLNVAKVYDLWQLQIAAYSALQALQQERMRSRTVFSEILLALSGNQIKLALQQFGIKDADQTCVIVTLGENAQASMDKVLESLPGARVLPFVKNIGKYHNLEEIKSFYKVKGKELEVGTLSESIVMRLGEIALTGSVR